MKYKKLGLIGLDVSVVGLGGLHFGDHINQAETSNIVNKALDSGINFIDTAPLYGNGKSEQFIGNAIRGKRDKVIVTTKVGLRPSVTPDGMFGVSVMHLTRKNIASALETSLRNLGTDYIDLYQLHAFDEKIPLEEILDTLNKYVDEGKIRYVGCSNYNGEELAQAFKKSEESSYPGLTSCQVHYNLIERRAEDEIIPLCRANNISIIVNRALARGILSGKYKERCPLPQNSRAMKSRRLKQFLKKSSMKLVEKLDMYAKLQGRTAAELSISWLLSAQKVDVVLLGVSNIKQLNDNLRAVEWSLSEEDYRNIDQIIEQEGQIAEIRKQPEVFFEK